MIVPHPEPRASVLSRNERLKYDQPLLDGTIAKTLADPTQERFSDDDYEFLKFHGIYQQDDRDLRKAGKRFMFMVRGRLPGGVVAPSVYLAFDRLATEFGNDTLRLTTRQNVQFHGVVKGDLGPFMRGIHEAMTTTFAACGDVNRNVLAPPTPSTSPVVDQILDQARKVSEELLPKTPAYHQIWVEGVELNLAETNEPFVDPLYGRTYLPRKFKIAFAIPPNNDVDVFTNDLGFVAIIKNDELLGYNVLAGGGMGKSHGNIQTFPRLADVIGFITPDQLIATAKAVVTIHRDFGDRTNRKHARLKYVLQEKGVEWFREQLQERVGFRLAPAQHATFDRQGDVYGWHKQQNGQWFLGLFVENGRIQDKPGYALKSALREIVQQHHPEMRLTASQNILIVNVADAAKGKISNLLIRRNIDPENQGTTITRAALACPALPTCGLALAESERVFPEVLAQFERVLSRIGLQGEEVIFRMTGCPNGCTRPYMAEVAFVGRSPGKYQIYLGGNGAGDRLNQLWKDNIKLEEFSAVLEPVFLRFKNERNQSERFGDWAHRVGICHVRPIEKSMETFVLHRTL